MMTLKIEQDYRALAGKKWERARRRAFWSQALAGLRGNEVGLLDFNDIAHRLHLEHAIYRGTQNIPLEQIIGSQDRYHDFTQAFLPLIETMRDRWKNIAALYLDPLSGGVPPIEVYKVGEVYFIKDGNHRVSVARQLDQRWIEAYVWEYQLPEGDAVADVESLLLEAGHRDFIHVTALDSLRPDHAIRLTEPGGYLDLLRQIAHYQDVLRQIDEVDVPYEEAVTAWYDMIYETIAQTIEDGAMLEDFPDRTTTDLFVWITQYRHELEQRYGHPMRVTATMRHVRDEAVRWPVRLWRSLRRRMSRQEA